MPTSVSNAVVAAGVVLPRLLCSSFTKVLRYDVLENSYANGESQRAVLTTSSRKSWQLTRSLTTAQSDELVAFYLARRGPTEAFYLYSPFDTVPRFFWDGTGAVTTGRYTVHFSTALVIAFSVPRHSGQFEIEELA